MHERLDAGEWKLDPPQVGGVLDRIVEGVRVTWVGPHQTLGMLDFDQLATTGNHGIGHPTTLADGADRDLGSVARTHDSRRVVRRTGLDRGRISPRARGPACSHRSQRP